MSVNIELPSNESLKLLAPDKEKYDIFTPMKNIKNSIIENTEERKLFKKTPLFVPGGQSTQLIVGATKDSDLKILSLSENLYNKYNLKRVYYSAYIPVNSGINLPDIKTPPTIREHRLYQADWLLRYYGFSSAELLNKKTPNFDINFDPKTFWAINNLDMFPVEINKVPYNILIKVPGIGFRGARKIISARRLSKLSFFDLKKMGISLKRAQYFITCNGKYYGDIKFREDYITLALAPKKDLNIIENEVITQLSFFNDNYNLLTDGNTSITGEF